VELIGAPIIQAILPLHKPALLQLVDDRHQAAWVHMQHLSQSLLAQPSGFAEHPENPRMRRRKTQTGKPLSEFATSV
jgi:ferric-dicitrate binding protein FerR (iron transport regulator)